MTKAQERAYQASKKREKRARALMNYVCDNKGYSPFELFNALMTVDEVDLSSEIESAYEEQKGSGQWVTTHNIKQEAALEGFLETLHNIY